MAVDCLFCVKSPDEWATTKEACRDELVVYCVFPPTLYIYKKRL